MDHINTEDEYKYWDPSIFGEFNSCLEEGISVGNWESSSPDGAQYQSSAAAKSNNILSEKHRREKLNQRLYALRLEVPNISKMDKASTIKDAIGYIQSLHDEEKKLKAEISELESGRISSHSTEIFQLDQEDYSTTFSSSNQKRTKIDQFYHSSAPTPSTLMMPSSHDPIELLELRVSSMGDRTLVVSLTCTRRTDTMVKLCEIFEYLNLKIITANITAFSGRLLKTVFLEGDEDERKVLSFKIRAAIAALNNPDSPMSI